MSNVWMWWRAENVPRDASDEALWRLKILFLPKIIIFSGLVNLQSRLTLTVHVVATTKIFLIILLLARASRAASGVFNYRQAP